MVAPRVYRWDDGNAPVARGERRSLCDILYACLVTGYGTQLPAGMTPSGDPDCHWTREFVNATFDKAVFRCDMVTPGNTGFYLLVDGASATVANKQKIAAYEVMTDVNTGLFPFAASALPELTLSAAAGTTARPWVLTADGSAFYFTVWTSITTAAPPDNSSTYKSELFFGDLVKWSPSDAYCCMLNIGYGSNGMYLTQSLASDAAGTNVYMPRKSSGVPGPVIPALTIGGGPCSTIPGQLGLSYTVGDPILLSRPTVNNGEAYSIRGWMPGLYVPCHPLAFDQLATVTVDLPSGLSPTQDFLSIRGYLASQNGNYFLSLNDWRA